MYLYVLTKHDEKIFYLAIAWTIRHEIAKNLYLEIRLGLGIFPVFGLNLNEINSLQLLKSSK